MDLKRKRRDRQLISLVPMIDVMLILLIFFMVTSTYLNLDMIPVVDATDKPATAIDDDTNITTILVRIGADGQAFFQGQAQSHDQLANVISAKIATDPLVSVVLLPSSRARTQDLVSTMDTLTSAGASRLRLVRLEAAE